MALSTTTIKPNTNKKIMLNRMYTENASLSSTLYTVGKYVGFGINNNSLSLTNTGLTTPIPLADGTVNDDGSNTMTGSGAGTNTTNNILIFKTGAGTTDNTAQNLIKDSSSVTASWAITTLTNNLDSAEYAGQWFYIKDSVALLKFETTGTCLEFRYGDDVTSNYYSKTYEASELIVGWNWLPVGILSDLTETGTTATLDSFGIIITTNNATDTFAAGDVIYDLLRQWDESDTYINFVLGYPTLDYTNYESVTRVLLLATQANGFDINSLIVMNSDTVKLPTNIAKFADESKSINDQFIFMIKDRIL